jgi:hypothetical protein
MTDGIITILILFFQNLDILQLLEKFGYPVVISIVLFLYFRKQLEKKDSEFCDLMKENNAYLKSLVDKEFSVKEKQLEILQGIRHAVGEIRLHQSDFQCANLQKKPKPRAKRKVG